ncbi:MAG: MiaB/RimO family radical SAM methylthiotransferase [Planctomycetia bacterium]|nr:MiaB/RimO family radical SAM methylthiotransferase [Planctomycetia bacterium]
MIPPFPTFIIHTLGCKVNQYESTAVAQSLLAAGWKPFTPDALQLDLCLLNTCAVTGESEAKSRKTVRQLIKRYAPRRVVVFGCSATNAPESFREINGVTEVVTAAETGGNRVSAVLQTLGLPLPLAPLPPALAGTSRHRVYLKVQDGCRQYCSYCIIPHLRKELSSVPIHEVVAQSDALLCRGYREIVLTGIHLGYYGRNPRPCGQAVWSPNDHPDAAKISLAVLMERLAQLPHDTFRLRLSSLEAHEATDDLLAVMAQHSEKICPHLHLSMQSGSPTVLRRMNRPGTLQQYVERCEKAKKFLDSPALTTDVIVGFPGETEREFLETCETCRQIGFSKIHIFPFSPREGTPAATMPHPVPAEEKHRRSLYLAEIEKELHNAFVEKRKGHPTQILAETYRDGQLTGTSERYLKETFPGTPQQIGTFVLRESAPITPRISADSPQK